MSDKYNSGNSAVPGSSAEEEEQRRREIEAARNEGVKQGMEMMFVLFESGARNDIQKSEYTEMQQLANAYLQAQSVEEGRKNRLTIDCINALLNGQLKQFISDCKMRGENLSSILTKTGTVTDRCGRQITGSPLQVAIYTQDIAGCNFLIETMKQLGCDVRANLEGYSGLIVNFDHVNKDYLRGKHQHHIDLLELRTAYNDFASISEQQKLKSQNMFQYSKQDFLLTVGHAQEGMSDAVLVRVFGADRGTQTSFKDLGTSVALVKGEFLNAVITFDAFSNGSREYDRTITVENAIKETERYFGKLFSDYGLSLYAREVAQAAAVLPPPSPRS